MLSPAEARKRLGLTLIELLVVIAIIAILIGLLMPAVQKVREASNRASCANNLKQLGLALHHYHGDHGKFPPGAVGPIKGVPPGLKHHGLGTYLLPYVEQDALFRQYRWDVSWFDPPNQPVVNQQLNVWSCPSAEANRLQVGSVVTVTPPDVFLFQGTAACADYGGMHRVDAQLLLTGLVDPVSNNFGIFEVNRGTRLAEVLDGTSQTIMLAECAGRPKLWQGRNAVPNVWLSGGPWASRALLFGRGSTPDGTAFYGPCAINCTNDREVYSFHPSGANVVLADGSVQFLQAGMSIRVFARLVTRAGGEVVSECGF
jgi:prepilin-type N-terminal cleavage/methylation domain-containing protein/prepilin-type processing-associated H-X9-DG protein